MTLPAVILTPAAHSTAAMDSGTPPDTVFDAALAPHLATADRNGHLSMLPNDMQRCRTLEKQVRQYLKQGTDANGTPLAQHDLAWLQAILAQLVQGQLTDSHDPRLKLLSAGAAGDAPAALPESLLALTAEGQRAQRTALLAKDGAENTTIGALQRALDGATATRSGIPPLSLAVLKSAEKSTRPAAASIHQGGERPALPPSRLEAASITTQVTEREKYPASPLPTVSAEGAAPPPLMAAHNLMPVTHSVIPQPAMPAVATPASVSLPHEAGSPAWQQALGQQLLMFARNGVYHASLTLHPRELGAVKVNMRLNEQQLQLHFAADIQQVRAVLETAMPQLRTSLSEGGFTLGQSSVGGGSGSDTAFSAATDNGRNRQRRDAGQDAGVEAIQLVATNEASRHRPRSGGIDIYA